MSQRSAKPKKSFYRRHGLQRTVRITNPKIGPRINEQPEFIQTLIIGGNRTVYALGDYLNDGNISALENKFMRIDTMVIPEGARMVRASALEPLIFADNINEEALAVEDDSLFYPGSVTQNIRIEVCGMIESQQYTELRIHSCDNRGNNFHHSEDGYRTCPEAQLSPDVEENGETNSTASRILHKLIVFHMPHSELIKSQGTYKGSDGKSHDNFTIGEILHQYFTDDHYSGEKNPTNSTELTHMKGGVFLIPMIMPDSRIAYYCIPNINGKSVRQTSVRNLLIDWMKSIIDFNQNPEDNWIGIAGNDATFCFLDEWSIFVGKNAQLLVKPKEEVYKESVLASAIS